MRARTASSRPKLHGLNRRVSSSRPSRQVQGGGRLGGRLAAVEDVVFRLAGDGLKRQPADIARPKLKDPHGDQFLVVGGDNHIATVGPNLALVKELGDHDRIRLDRPERLPSGRR